MPCIAERIQQGATNLWIVIPTAVVLWALHGLGPGHSKTMMASRAIALVSVRVVAVWGATMWARGAWARWSAGCHSSPAA